MTDPRRTGERVLRTIEGAEELTVVAPFVKVGPLERLMAAVKADATITVYTRWHPDEVAAGISDTAILDLVHKRGGSVWLHPLLHAKAYLGGGSALVGSANTSDNGLGWAKTPALELLVGVATDDEAVRALLELLEVATAEATPGIRDEIDRRAQLLRDERGIPPPRGGGATEVASVFGVPRYLVPEAAWPAYQGKRPPDIQAMVARDLNGLGIPPGLASEESFNALVGAALLQGFTGRLMSELAGVPVIPASQLFAQRMAAVGEPVHEEELDERYRAFVRWIAHFVPEHRLRATGYSLG